MPELGAEEKLAVAERVQGARLAVDPTREEFLRSLEVMSDQQLRTTIEELRADAARERKALEAARVKREKRDAANHREAVARREKEIEDRIRSLVRDELKKAKKSST